MKHQEDLTAKPAAHRPGYWQAEGLVAKGWTRFEAATAAGNPSRQRSAFFQLAKYQGKTLHILQTAVSTQNENLVQAALHNILTLHGGLMHMHRTAPDIIPLPLLIGEDDREAFTSDLVMRALGESGNPLDLPSITARAQHLDMLGRLKEVEIEGTLERLLAAGHIRAEGDGYVTTSHPYTELDLDTQSLRALLCEESYARFHDAGFRQITEIDGRFATFQTEFPEFTGMTHPEPPYLFHEVAHMLLLGSLAEARQWTFQDIIHSRFPRPYQREAFNVFRRSGYAGNVIEAPTGSGKTLIGMMCIEDWLHSLQVGESILVLVPTSAYQQQWLGELCFNKIGLQLSPEMIFTGTPSQLDTFIGRTGEHPPVILLTYTGLSQLSSGIGKGGFDSDSLEIFLQEANVQYVVLDEVHKVVADMHSISTEVTRILVEWQQDGSLRGLVGFSGTAAAYRSHFEQLQLDLVHTIPIDDLVAAGFVAPFAELGVPFSNSSRERTIRDHLEAAKASLRDYFALLGADTLRRWFAAVPMADRLRIGHQLLGMLSGRKDWQSALEQRFIEWESGGEIKLTEMNLLLIVQIANGWTDSEMVAQADADRTAFEAMKAKFDTIRHQLLKLIYLPQTITRLRADGFTTTLDRTRLAEIETAVPVTHRGEAVKDTLATTITGLYAGLKTWYMRVGEGRVESIKAVIEAERAVREISGTIVFDAGRRIHWREELVVPGYEGVGGLFAQMLGDSRFTTIAALSSEMYLTYSKKDPLPDRIADFIDSQLLLGETADAIFNLAVQGLALSEEDRASIEKFYRQKLDDYLFSLRDIHAPRPGNFDKKVMRPLRRSITKMELGMDGERLLARLDRRNDHLASLVQTFFDYAMLAHKFRTAHIAELEQVSGARQKFFVVTMPGTGQRKQLMYDLTSRIVDAPSLPVNLIIVSNWARTGWNVITPNLLIDATATHDVTAWQQLRGRAIRAWRSWTNDCYRLETILLDNDPLAFAADHEPHADPVWDEALSGLLKEIATPRQYKKIMNEGLHTLATEKRHQLAVKLLETRNKVTHVYELVKAFGSGSQVTYDRTEHLWHRKDGIAAKHAREVSVNPFTGVKSQGDSHAPLVYVNDPRHDLPIELQEKLTAVLHGADDNIVNGWLGFPGSAR